MKLTNFCSCHWDRKIGPSEAWCLECMRPIFRTWVKCNACGQEVNKWYQVDPEFVMCEECKDKEDYEDYRNNE